MKGIADTGFIVAFLNRRDTHHRWSVEIAHTVSEPLFTCEAVLAEAAFHLGSVPHVLALIHTGLIGVNFDFNASEKRIEALGRKYQDRRPDLADLCLICLSEQFPARPVVTVDGDFRIYRRHQRERIPVILPPEI